jgi:hypothetical protein
MSSERVWGDYTPDDYRFPELYVEGGEGGKCIWVDERAGRYFRAERPGALKMCMVPYE